MNYDETDVADRYDEARKLLPETMNLWMESIATLVGTDQAIRRILDVGCGTGRFSGPLATKFSAKVIGIDPSRSMLARAESNVERSDVRFCLGDTRQIPVEDGSIDLIFVSMVYHHIEDPHQAAREFRRVLRDEGMLCVRNSTVEWLDKIPYLKHFPMAVEFNRRRLPSQDEIVYAMQAQKLVLHRHELVEQEFACSPIDYVAKISKRGLSDLMALGDEEFNEGLARMKEAAAVETGPVMEPIDLFVFRKPA
jgi:ubiquinone/menaquinone biosynthesis C-methylase UbiE